ncbi:MAG: TetR/AcrR family transcriptional regulator [Sporolactobacillus sp.]
MEKTHRRRGKELEGAIIEATWKLMQGIGYAKMTMDDIAQAAHTNKNAIYRRWDSKLTVAFEAIKKYIPVSEIFKSLHEPDNGNLRDDLVELMCEILPMIEMVGSQNLKAIIRDRLPEISKNVDLLVSRNLMSKNFIRKYLDSVLERAFERGEIKTTPEKIAETVMGLPSLLLLSRIIGEQDYDRHFVEFLVDSILLPVFVAQ